MANKRMLISLAHPDDESFGLGGFIAKYVAEGVDVYYLCATNGERGTIPEAMQDGRTVKEIRLAELDCASEKLGFKQVFRLGYKDSGMMGSPDNDDPECLWQAPLDEVTRRVVEVMREIQPQVVITFNEYGGYGHPDHIKIQRATVQAFHLAGDANYLTDTLPAYTPQRLYYNNIPRFVMQFGILMMRLRRQNPRKLGVNKDIDMVAILDHIQPSHASVNISAWLDAWDEASACHTSQGGGGGFARGIPKSVRKRLGVRQGFTLIYPQPRSNRVFERDLFQNIQPDTVTAPAAV